MDLTPKQLLSILLFAAAGFCLFLLLLNRRLILIRDSRLKKPVILAFLMVLTGGAAIFGFLFHEPPWLCLPLGFFGVIAAGEVRRALIRRRTAGSLPVDSPRHPVRVSQPVTTTDLAVHRYSLTIPGWQGPPFRVVHLTDLHVNRSLPFEFYEEVFAIADGTRPDLAFFTGDFVSKKSGLPTLAKLLRPVEKGDNFAVLGNHDYWTDPRGVAATVEKSGLTLLKNGSATIEIGGTPVRISGYEYPWGTKKKNVEPAPPGVLHLVLTHTPDNIYRISRSGAHCVFSGHNHAGPVRLPLLGPIVVPSIYGRRFDHGHFVIKGTHLFVSSGIGAGDPEFRLYCRPDILVVDISGKAAD